MCHCPLPVTASKPSLTGPVAPRRARPGGCPSQPPPAAHEARGRGGGGGLLEGSIPNHPIPGGPGCLLCVSGAGRAIPGCWTALVMRG